MALLVKRLMRSSANVFRSDAFSAISLTNFINLMPDPPGQIASLGIVAEDSLTTREMGVGRKSGRLRLIPAVPVGADGLEYGDDPGELIRFEALHLPQKATIHAAQLTDVINYDRLEDQNDALENLMTKIFTDMLADQKATREYHSMGALSGKLLNSDGAVLENYYTKFGIAEPAPTAVNFTALAADPAGLRLVIDEIAGKMKDATTVVPAKIHCFCGAQFYRWLLTLPEIIEAYKYSSNNDWLRSRSFFGTFEYAGVIFERYDSSTVLRGGVPVKFIADTDALFVPLIPISEDGKSGGLLEIGWAPAATFPTLNRPGLPHFINPEFDTAQSPRWVKLNGESNPAIVNRLPGACIRAVGSKP